jgi:hypothetical protein
MQLADKILMSAPVRFANRVLGRLRPARRPGGVPEPAPEEVTGLPATAAVAGNPPAHYVVVFEFGKVASSAIVDSLNRVAGVVAEQAHFLGAEMLQQMLGQLLYPGGADYFHRHRLGQFVENIRITREINAFRAGLRPASRLTLISVTREPLDWLRASLVQDLQGYLPGFARLGRHWGLDWDGDAALIRAVLPRLLGTLAARLEEAGGPDAFLAGPRDWSRLIESTGDAESDLFLESFAELVLRPVSWFYAHFPAGIGIGIDRTDRVEQGLCRHAAPGWCELHVLRYERLEEGIRRVVERLGLDGFRFERVNESRDKPHAQVVAAVCAGPEAAALRAQYLGSRYCRQFGYA